MSQRQVLERIHRTGIVSIVRGVESDDLLEIVEALVAGGIEVVEITANTAGAVDMIETVDSHFSSSEVSVGAGTVLDAATARQVQLAGAEFLVSPHLNPAVVTTGNRYGNVVIPGVLTPTEAVRAYEHGASMCKVFPASTLGPGHISSLNSPLDHVDFLPTGGVSLENVQQFIAAGAVGVGVGSGLLEQEAIETGAYDRITRRATQFVDAIDAARD